MDDLLAEVRALRAELNQAASVSLRAQLLVARLQLQEQRINTVARQLADVQQRLADAARAEAALAPQLKMFEEAAQKPEMENFLKPLKAQLEQFQKTEQELRIQEASLTGLLVQEQSRWTEFNERVDQLERGLAVRTP